MYDGTITEELRERINKKKRLPTMAYVQHEKQVILLLKCRYSFQYRLETVKDHNYHGIACIFLLDTFH